ncbi:LysR family transcriptional regulator [Mediterraneibacter glycyrrhizinilyticus]|uniref:LysR family transcriptional regulator n=1 Tax=Mediterraneibacter glycyrrhizinilyticus TaxID=342942 RepID=UPI001961392D|nr:LysR family transcriptional regulator [Mediterraneibacter glycyrrhizinilyticus]MBM6752959.1 LysR family transcriptional regulator [Mediterraneibacter glycyrrhizinilyticus]
MYNPQLETFITVADLGSFNKAAEALYITPPAVTKQINLLEKDLGLTLFVRTHRGLSLTEAGKSLYKDAKYVIQYCKDSVERAKQAMAEKDNIIRIGTSPITPANPIMQLWAKVQKQYPDIKLQMIPYMNSQESAREILKNLGTNIDVVGGIFDETMLRLRQCSGMELSRQRICAAVSLNHPLAEKELLTYDDLEGENFLMMHRGWSKYVDELRDDIWKNHPGIRVTDFEIYSLDIFNRCENSNDILMVVENWKDVQPMLKVIPVEWKYTIPYGILYSKEPTALVKRFLKDIRKAME